MKKETETSSRSFSQRLREETKDIHTMAERCSFMRGFLRGVASPASYADYLEGMRRIYSTLEEAIEAQRDHPIVRKFYFPELFRVSAIEHDLEFFGGRPLRANKAADQALEAFATRLKQIADYAPECLISHAYTRYMGDLSGGQILSKIVSKSMGLDREGEGLAFYRFEAIKDIPGFKKDFRARLDRLPEIEPSLPDRIVEETITCFRLNIQFFETLEGNALVAAYRQIFPRKKSNFVPNNAASMPSHLS
mgnify:CR=1 FL=1